MGPSIGYKPDNLGGYVKTVLRQSALALLLGLSLSLTQAVSAASLTSAAPSLNLTLTAPTSIPTSGTNRSGKILKVTAYASGHWSSPHDHVTTVIYLYVCGRRIAGANSQSPEEWYSQLASVSGLVPNGCSYRVTSSSTSYSINTWVHGQYLGLK